MVEDACSGINSTLSVAAAAVFYHLWMRRPWWWLAVTLPLSLVFVFAGNTARIAGGSMLLQWTGIDLFKMPFPHEFVGLVVIAVCLLLVVSLDQLLLLVTRRSADEVVGGAGARVEAELPPRWWLPFAGIAGVLGVAMLPGALGKVRGASDLYEVQPSGLPQPDTFQLPAVLAGWEQIEKGDDEKSFVEMNGILSRVWRYRRGQEAVAVAFDYPFHGMHDVTKCYVNAGWESVSRRELPLKGENGNGSVQHLQRARDEHALLMVSTVSADGRFIENDNLKGTLLTRFGNSVDVPMSFRIQLFASAITPIPGVAEERIAGLFGEAHEALIGQLRGRALIAPRRLP
jgi:exosortase/archaeosortase family protein